jgi:molybdenum cofactor cytidylyltransferase
MSYLISVIILAAGKSTRMGTQKLCMQLGEHTILEQTVDNYLASKADEIIVVTGHEAQKIRQLIAHKPVTIVYNPHYYKGMSTSIAAGLQTVRATIQSVVIALGDQPYIHSDIINFIIDEHRSSKKGISVPVYKGTRGHPTIFDMKYKEELLKLEGDRGGIQVTDRHSDDVFEIDVEYEEVIADIDTIDKYNQMTKKFKQR